MSLRSAGVISIPASKKGAFDHGAFEPQTRRVFVAHTGRNAVEVIDHHTRQHLATLDGFPEAAGVVADKGQVLVTNRGAAQLAWLDTGIPSVHWPLRYGSASQGGRNRRPPLACRGCLHRR